MARECVCLIECVARGLKGVGDGVDMDTGGEGKDMVAN